MLIQSSHINCRCLFLPLVVSSTNFDLLQTKKWKKLLQPFSSSEFQIYGKSVTGARRFDFSRVSHYYFAISFLRSSTVSSARARLRISNIWGAFSSTSPLIVLFVFHSSCTVSTLPSDTNPIANTPRKAKKYNGYLLFSNWRKNSSHGSSGMLLLFSAQAII